MTVLILVIILMQTSNRTLQGCKGMEDDMGASLILLFLYLRV